MRDASAEIDGQSFDAVIIGGGINGAGVARDAALRGLKVCLFEKGDFGSGTSSKSTKIAHGGLRYLRNLEFGLVREAQLERRWLRQALPHLVQPLSFCYPVYRDGSDPLWKVRLGLTVYDLLDGRRQPHKSLAPAEALEANPSLRSNGLVGAMRYWDDRMDDARVCIETVLSAEEAGAVCFNYTAVVAVERTNDGFEVTVQDSLDPACKPQSVRCRAIVNCAGPWSDAILAPLRPNSRPIVTATKGVHLLVPRLTGADALVLENVADQRTFFAIPWQDQTLIGTTDTRFSGDPDSVAVEPEDLKYLLEAANYFLPGAKLSEESVMYRFAGLRPLVAPGSNSVAEGKISRRHLVLREPEGVVTLIGGKFTTFRRMAEHAVNALLEELGLSARRGQTKVTPYWHELRPLNDKRIDPELWKSLEGRYGPRAGAVFDTCMEAERLRQPLLEGQPVVLGELLFALRHEKVRSVSDFIERRTHLAWHKPANEIALSLKQFEASIGSSQTGANCPQSSMNDGHC